jgi:Domain of unknown function (DUF4157)
MPAFVQRDVPSRSSTRSKPAPSRVSDPELDRLEAFLADSQREATPAAVRGEQPNHPAGQSSRPASPPHYAWDFGRLSLYPSASESIRRGLNVNRPGDRFEQAADHLAHLITGATQASEFPRSTRFPRPLPADPGAPASHAPANMHGVLRSPGEPLDSATRSFMEARFRHDFSQVRVHRGVAAEQSARDLSARGYTVGNHIVFAPNQFAPDTQKGRRLIAHELAHVVQQATAAAMVQREVDPDGADAWQKLSAGGQEQARELWDECSDWKDVIGKSQTAHFSSQRGEWINSLSEMSVRINALESDTKIAGVKQALTELTNKIGHLANKYGDEWVALKKRYAEERRWLLSARIRSTDSTEAAKYLEEVFHQADQALPMYRTDEDYAELKRVIERQDYIRMGALRGARVRAKQLREMMDAVADLLRKGEDANKFIPEWSDRVTEEAAYLDSFAKLAKEAGRDYAGELADLSTRLTEKQKETAKVGPPEKSWAEKGVDLVKGGVEAIAGIFIEAAKEAVDLCQILLHFESLGQYEPRFISDMAAAAEQGATTGDLLKGMVVGMIETPERFLKACRDGDWEAIGKETVNLYMLAKTMVEAPETIKKIPEAIKKLPELLARTNESLRILRQRTVSLGLKNEGRLRPEPTPPTPKPVPPPAPKPAPPPTVHQGGNQGPPGQPTGMLRSTDSPPGVKVDASHPILKGKVPANDTTPPPHPQQQVQKVAVNGPKDVPPARQIDRAKGSAHPDHNATRPHATGGDPPSKKDAKPAVQPDPEKPSPTPPSPAATGGGSTPTDPAHATPAKPTPDKAPAGTADKPQTKPTETPAPADLKPLLTAEDLNEFVAQEKNVTTPKRRLYPPERANARKVVEILERVRKGDQKALLEIDKLGLKVKALERGELVGWHEVYLTPAEIGGLNQMRLLIRIGKGGDIKVRLLQMH